MTDFLVLGFCKAMSGSTSPIIHSLGPLIKESDAYRPADEFNVLFEPRRGVDACGLVLIELHTWCCAILAAMKRSPDKKPVRKCCNHLFVKLTAGVRATVRTRRIYFDSDPLGVEP